MKLVIFDMDGTLVDSVALTVEAATVAFEALGQAVPDDALIRSVSGLNLHVGVSRLAPDADEAMIEALGKRYRQEYHDRVSANLREPLFPGTVEVLEALSARDDTFLALATGKELHGATRVLSTHNILPLFSSLQTPDNNMSKPHPEMIHTAMAAVGAKPTQTVMIGDTSHDIKMAVAAKVPSIGVSWGYHAVDELNDAGANAIIDDYSQLIGVIDAMLEA